MKMSRKLVKPFRVDDGKHFRLKDHDPAHTAGVKTKEEANQLLQDGVAQLAEHQNKLYAQNSWALLLIFQAMDAAGKDGVIKHVMSGVNPQGCQVFSFKAPSAEDLDHDYMWRTMKSMPQRGRIGIFNRSYYEEVLVVRVHPELLKAEKIPPKLITKDIWKERYEDIRSFERYMTRNGIVIRKFFLNLSKKEQKQRFLARLDHHEKNWKFSAADIRERQFWDQYVVAYEDMFHHTSSEWAPWFIIPADHKWFSRLCVSEIIVAMLKSLGLKYPKVSDEQLAELQNAKEELLNEKGSS
jgi:PPK2 family polyphosphate:nucleotide phosphotransferase